MNTPTAIFLMGPTASGKSALAIEIAKQLPCDIISVDSAMVYKGLDIGTAKPSLAEQAAFPHQLIDLCRPDEIYSAADFCRDARQAIENSVRQGRIPLLVGGTMLYFHALKNGLSTLPPADAGLRTELESQANQIGYPGLHQVLTQKDPRSANKIHPHDAQRILRALEVYELTGTPLSQWQENKQKSALNYPVLSIALHPSSRADLHQRIAQRFETMLAQGFIEEVQALLNQGQYSHELPALRAVGYRQVYQYLSGTITQSDLPAHVLAATRQLAKRQMTWLRRWPDLYWFANVNSKKDLYKLIEKVC